MCVTRNFHLFTKLQFIINTPHGSYVLSSSKYSKAQKVKSSETFLIEIICISQCANIIAWRYHNIKKLYTYTSWRDISHRNFSCTNRFKSLSTLCCSVFSPIPKNTLCKHKSLNYGVIKLKYFFIFFFQ